MDYGTLDKKLKESVGINNTLILAEQQKKRKRFRENTFGVRNKN